MTHALLAAIAIAVGLLTAAALFVPYVASSYRRHGGITAGRTLMWVMAVIYSWSLWAYTLLSLPDPAADYQCVGSNLDPTVLITDLAEAYAETGLSASFLTHHLVLQIGLNVVLFLPLGFFLRVLGGRGVIVATLAGLAISGFIETSQITGLWGIYPCPYRVFDVEDLITNTAGATLGSLMALLVPRSPSGRDGGRVPHAPRPVTRTRRSLAMLSDMAAFWLANVVASIGVQAVLLYVLNDRESALGSGLAETTGLIAAIAVAGVVVMVTGRSIGDHAVLLRYAGGPMAEAPARLLRFLSGAGGYGLLLLTPWPALGTTLAFVSLVATFVTRDGRGLPGLVTGRSLVDARVPSRK